MIPEVRVGLRSQFRISQYGAVPFLIFAFRICVILVVEFSKYENYGGLSIKKKFCTEARERLKIWKYYFWDRIYQYIS